MGPTGSQWISMGSRQHSDANVDERFQMSSYEVIPNGLQGVQMGPSGSQWVPMGLNGLQQIPVGPSQSEAFLYTNIVKRQEMIRNQVGPN